MTAPVGGGPDPGPRDLSRCLATGLARTRALLVAAGILISATASAAAEAPFEADVRAFEAQDLRTPPPPDPVLFLGSSTITRWTDLAAAFPGFTVLNRGFGGSQLTDVLNHFERVVLRYAPPLIVLYEGDNDLSGGRTVDQVFGDWTNFVGRVERELPGTGVLFVSVKPSPSRASLLGVQQALNGRIAADCGSRARCRFVDVATPMLDSAGRPRAELFVSDMLHLNPAGYEVWKAALGPGLEAWAAAQPARSVRAPSGTALLDFGSPDLASGTPAAGGPEHWNNIPAGVGSTGQGRVSTLVTADGVVTTAAWVMTSRFNGANQNGTTAPAPFPDSATRDSLFGNTETFGGLANVTPAFRLTGLRSGIPHTLAFYASRTGVSDNRETRYTVTGRTTSSVDLDAANNVATVATLGGMEPDPDGAFAVALSPGPRNNNANHFTYLGVLRIAEESDAEGRRVFLLDLGAADSPTGTAAGPASLRWNDVTTAVGTDPEGAMERLISTDGAATGIGLRMVSRFNGANLNGTTASAVFPATATQDSLVGNLEAFNGLAAVTPVFRLTGLDRARVYSLGFFASRVGVADRRETRYRVQGATEANALLEPVDNTHRIAWVTGLQPDAAGEIRVSLEPGPANDSPNHFTYLGTLQLEWRESGPVPAPTLSMVRATPGNLRVRLGAGFGRACRIERSSDLITWTPSEPVSPLEGGLDIDIDIDIDVDVDVDDSAGAGFLRAVDVP